ncbi:TIGR02452 family protein [Aureivirga sp. CE67]|uniref:TIGR02452 family protein n=1 Tax=Aureivirga sp. CE67 TaxID=1788983 RepID=UPI0018CA3016|nr:TIGR02452 family protein [Aureivirga sp. CE67]
MKTNRAKRKNLAEETLKILENGFFQTNSGEKINIKEIQEKAEKNTTLYTPEDSDQLLKNDFKESETFETKIWLERDTTLNTTRNLIKNGFKDAICLNFASAKNPGGGFLGGSQAQEESIARATGLYPTLLKCSEYYETNRNTKSCFYTDYMIYSPNVPIFKSEDGENLDALEVCSVITAPAVNAGVVRNKEPQRVDEIEKIMKRRIEKVLAIALENNHKSIVLGAWGCGVFQNNPEEIALYFKEIIEGKFPNQFQNIVFAIYSNREHFVAPFEKYFGNTVLNEN